MKCLKVKRFTSFKLQDHIHRHSNTFVYDFLKMLHYVINILYKQYTAKVEGV